MSTSTSAASHGQQPGGLWSYLAPYAGPPIAAGAGIVPVFYWLAKKSAQQLGNPVPQMTLREAVAGGLKIAPTTGSIIGSQMVIQHLMECALGGLYGNQPQDASNNRNMLISSIVTGALSAPVLAGFNSQAMGGTFLQAVRRLTPSQTAAIAAQETIFVYSLRASEPVSSYMKDTYGNNLIVEYVSAFLTGATGSFCNHSANTALTRWQKGLKIEHVGQLMKGSPARALALGGFSVLYTIGKEILMPKKTS